MAQLRPDLLRRLMAERGVSVQDLASEVGVSRYTVYSWLKRGRIDTGALARLAEFFGVPEQQLSYGSAGVDAQVVEDLVLQVLRIVNSCDASLSDSQLSAIIAQAYEAYAHKELTDELIRKYLRIAGVAATK